MARKLVSNQTVFGAVCLLAVTANLVLGQLPRSAEEIFGGPFTLPPLLQSANSIEGKPGFAIKNPWSQWPLFEVRRTDGLYVSLHIPRVLDITVTLRWPLLTSSYRSSILSGIYEGKYDRIKDSNNVYYGPIRYKLLGYVLYDNKQRDVRPQVGPPLESRDPPKLPDNPIPLSQILPRPPPPPPPPPPVEI